MPNEAGLNIQGNSRTATSNDGHYTIIKTAQSSCVLLVGNKVQEYRDTDNRTIQSIVISNNGLIVMSFDSISTKTSNVRIFNGGFHRYSLVYDFPWQLHFGAGLSITPNSDKLAIGSPGENRVYTYNLDASGSVVMDSKLVIVGPASKSFGWKVGLSKSGNTLAIASPSSRIESLDVGAVYIYVINEGKWEQLDLVLYGSNDGLRIGVGGVSVDDNIGIISVQDDNLGRRRSFMVRFSNRSNNGFVPFKIKYAPDLLLPYNKK